MGEEWLDTKGGKLRVSPGLVVQIIAYVIALMLTYTALDTRVTRLEVKGDRTAEDIGEIKRDIKELLARPVPPPLFKP